MAVLRALVSLALLLGVEGLSEEERQEERIRRGFTEWPPTQVYPNTKTYRELLLRREAQLMALPTSNGDLRWGAWRSLGQMWMMGNYTQHGWGVADAPKALVKELQTQLRAGMGVVEKPERVIQGQDYLIETEEAGPPTLVPLSTELRDKVLETLRPMHEAWAGMKLRPTIAYGFRLYHNLSTLMMHVDKMESHVISSILHLDHEYDDELEPWPIMIEDLSGQVQSLSLKRGQLMFYESAKCMHGRPTKLKGSWYSSIFIHYRPLDWNHSFDDPTYFAPPHWRDDISRHPFLQNIAKQMPELRGAEVGITGKHGSAFESVFVNKDLPLFSLQEVVFENKLEKPVDFFYVDPDGKEARKGQIPAGGKQLHHAYHEHKFRFKAGGKVVVDHVIDTRRSDNTYAIAVVKGGQEL